MPPLSPPASPPQGRSWQQSVPQALGAGAWVALLSQLGCWGSLEPQPEQRELGKYQSLRTHCARAAPSPLGEHPSYPPRQGAARGSPVWKMPMLSGLSGPFLGPQRHLSLCASSPISFQRRIFGSWVAAPSLPARAGASGEGRTSCGLECTPAVPFRVLQSPCRMRF